MSDLQRYIAAVYESMVTQYDVGYHGCFHQMVSCLPANTPAYLFGVLLEGAVTVDADLGPILESFFLEGKTGRFVSGCTLLGGLFHQKNQSPEFWPADEFENCALAEDLKGRVDRCSYINSCLEALENAGVFAAAVASVEWRETIVERLATLNARLVMQIEHRRATRSVTTLQATIARLQEQIGVV